MFSLYTMIIPPEGTNTITDTPKSAFTVQVLDLLEKEWAPQAFLILIALVIILFILLLSWGIKNNKFFLIIILLLFAGFIYSLAHYVFGFF